MVDHIWIPGLREGIYAGICKWIKLIRKQNVLQIGSGMDLTYILEIAPLQIGHEFNILNIYSQLKTQNENSKYENEIKSNIYT